MLDSGTSTSSDRADFPRRVRDGAARQERAPTAPLQNPPLAERADAPTRYRELFELAPDPYLVTDVHGTIREANAAAANLLGVEAGSLRGKSIQSFFDDSSRSQYTKQLDRLCDIERIADWEIWITAPRTRQRTPVVVSLSRAPARDDNKIGYRWILHDITRQKRAEDALRELNRDLELRVASRTAQLAAATLKKDQLIYSERKARDDAEKANRVKSEFLALLSHEFRTPLQAIFGYTELLEREIHGPLTEAQRRDLKRIQQSQEHLLRLITTILDFARLDSGHDIEMQLQPVVVNEILRDMEGFIGPQLESRNVAYAYRCDDKSLQAHTDGAKLEQIILNLLANAIKFTEPGGAIALECLNAGERVHICVRDTGVGIPADKMDAIFEPFVQIHSPIASGGTGLGLPISRRLATAMGGELTAESVPGQGSTFTLSLPTVAVA